jgi:DNA primase
MIPVATIREIRSRVDPVDVIGRRIELRKSGKSFSASCPFHPDRTPSFRVYPDSKRFKCFGCGARGDAFEFVQKFDGKDFRTVVRELAGEVGLPMPEEPGGPRTTPPETGRSGLDRACEAALTHWSKRLWGDTGAEARRYLVERGLDGSTVRQFRLGLAPRDWHDLQASLATYPTEELLRAGLLGEGKNDAPYDRFRGRIMFPFVQLDRRVVGFAGRLLATSGNGEQEPKYLNSPETPIFKKGQLLFGLPEAQGAIRRTGRAVLVEGYFDALALHQAGLAEVVAAGGTALSEHQIGQLQRCGCEELVVLFDADEAGVQAPAQIAPALLHSGLSTRVARLPGQGGTDPDTYVRAHGAGGLAGVLDAAMPLTEWLLERAIAARGSRNGTRGVSVEQKLLIVRDLRPFVAAARTGLPRALFEQRIARRLELYIVALRAELGRSGDRRGEREDSRGGSPWHA